MASSYTASLRVTLPATGENVGTWGTLANSGITQLLEDAIAGYISIAMTDANYTLVATNGASDEARNMFVNMTGALTAARNVICPSVEKLYYFRNSTTGGNALTLKTVAGTGISVAAGEAVVLLCDGANVVNAVSGGLTNATATASTSGTTIDFTGIPTWVKRITVNFAGVSMNITGGFSVQIGDSGGIETTGYITNTQNISTTSTATNPTTGFSIPVGSGGVTMSGVFHLTLLDAATNTWSAFGVTGGTATAAMVVVCGSKPLSSTLDRVRITSTNGTDTFDAGLVNVQYD